MGSSFKSSRYSFILYLLLHLPNQSTFCTSHDIFAKLAWKVLNCVLIGSLFFTYDQRVLTQDWDYELIRVGKMSSWLPRWRHQMETFSALLGICAGNSPATGEFPSQRPVTRSFNVFFDLCLSRRLSKQSWGWWSGTPSRTLWRHCNEYLISSAVSAVELKSTSQAKMIDGLHKYCWIYSTRPHYV